MTAAVVGPIAALQRLMVAERQLHVAAARRGPKALEGSFELVPSVFTAA